MSSGVAILAALAYVVNRNTAQRVAALHTRFEKPTAVHRKQDLLLGLANWKIDLEELQEAESAPSYATVLSSLRILVGGV